MYEVVMLQSEPKILLALAVEFDSKCCKLLVSFSSFKAAISLFVPLYIARQTAYHSPRSRLSSSYWHGRASQRQSIAMFEKLIDAREQSWAEWSQTGTPGEADHQQLLGRIEGPQLSRHKSVLILDGGLGTTLEDECQITFSSTDTPTWSSHLLVSAPETLAKIHKSFVEVGADIILTATYQASFEGFSATRRHDAGSVATQGGSQYSQTEVKNIMQSAVPLARSAFGSKKGLVALSLGAYGATTIPSTEYTGKYPPNMQVLLSLELWHTERVMAFEQHQKTWDNIDLVAFETLPRLNEIESVRGAMRRLSKPKPFWISCVFPNDDQKLPDGSEVNNVVRAMLAVPTASITSTPIPMGIGINCTKVQKLRLLIGCFEDAAASMNIQLPYLVIYPDGADNLTYDTTSQTWTPTKPATTLRDWHEEMFDIVQEVEDRDKWAGIIVGGCCKTKPQHIARLSKRVRESKYPTQTTAAIVCLTKKSQHA
jgi:homocysteine S-methyltransferase